MAIFLNSEQSTLRRGLVFTTKFQSKYGFKKVLLSLGALNLIMSKMPWF